MDWQKISSPEMDKGITAMNPRALFAKFWKPLNVGRLDEGLLVRIGNDFYSFSYFIDNKVVRENGRLHHLLGWAITFMIYEL